MARNPLIFLPAVVRLPDSQGWFSVHDYNIDVANYSLTALVHWKSGGKDGDYLLRMEVARYDNGILDKDHNPIPAWAGHINAHGILLAGDGSIGQQIGSLNLCDIPQSPLKVRCAYGVRLSVWDRAIVGSVHGYEYDTHSHGRSAFVTFDWDPAGC